MAQEGIPARHVSFLDASNRTWTVSNDKPLPVDIKAPTSSNTIKKDIIFAPDVEVAAGPTYTPLSTTSLEVLWFAIIGKTGNAANIMLGTSTRQTIAVAAGDRFDISAQPGTHIDLANYGINGTAGDGVHLIYQEA